MEGTLENKNTISIINTYAFTSISLTPYISLNTVLIGTNPVMAIPVVDEAAENANKYTYLYLDISLLYFYIIIINLNILYD
jgi:hypothetical protein